MPLNRQLVRQKTAKTINGLLYSVFPNIEGNLQTINGWIFSDTSGAMSKIGGVDTTNIVQLR